ncbi:MAG: 1-(5-phosphoribosyl)-5-[(5-phosphoribosylamino)methylideneamino]imidazole-4-carboxamide isomerase [Candidatus Makaraimicrobium thalassicum]|nr:MAG: 1-(5-phosphoribosyl)-5-[(5-phosphoribosylamino)methylideneamino]imidazole-4-carboxamide isomerase [Candidatus Omnitrophota bacterium]
MKVIPAIDLMDEKTVRLEQGQYERRLSYEIGPVDAARRWEAMGAEMIHIVDLDGARQGRPVNLPVVGKIAGTVSIPVEAGGGFRTEEDIQKALDSGVWRVVVGSRALEDLAFARKCMENFGERMIISIDVKDHVPSVQGWKKTVNVDLFTVLEWFSGFGAGEIIYTDIKKDGTLSGPDIDNLERILSRIKMSMISAGGVRTLDHIKQLKTLESQGLTGVIVGRALYEGTLDLKEAIDAGKADNPVS